MTRKEKIVNSNNETKETNNKESSSNLIGQQKILPLKKNIFNKKNFLDQILTKQIKSSKTKSAKGSFTRAQYKDYVDHSTIKLIGYKLDDLKYKSGKITLNANIIGVSKNLEMNTEHYLIQWTPQN